MGVNVVLYPDFELMVRNLDNLYEIMDLGLLAIQFAVPVVKSATSLAFVNDMYACHINILFCVELGTRPLVIDQFLALLGTHLFSLFITGFCSYSSANVMITNL